MPTRDEILKALEAVIDPELRRSIVELGMVRSIEQPADGVVDVTVSLTTPGLPDPQPLRDRGRARPSAALEGVTRVDVAFDVLSDQEKAGAAAEARPRLAARGRAGPGRERRLHRLGQGRRRQVDDHRQPRRRARRRGQASVGVLDADVWGYSIPRMFGVSGRPPVSPERKIVPLEAGGVKIMSIGFFVEEDAAVVWRGPMLHKALTQFLEDVDWGELDFLLVDLPPGTGDVSMTLAQLLPQAQVRDRHDAAGRPRRRSRAARPRWRTRSTSRSPA